MAPLLPSLSQLHALRVPALAFSSSGAPGEARSVKRLPPDFGSGHRLTVREFEPHIGFCADGAEPAWDSLSPSLSLKINFKKKAPPKTQAKSL